ncbi:hypothetical protein BY996DRAFT_6408073 [Phakopsora pachyrhizi]|nr:hypothetical protein BY996DRAFT_6408073 [Phakopsora pachyrhizi]
MINVTKDKLFDYEYDQFGKTIENGFINLVECFFSSTPVECYDEQRSDTRKRRRTYACLEEEIGQERWNERTQSMASVCKKLSEDFKVALKRLNLSLVRTLDPINGSSNNLDSSSSSSTHHHIMRTCQPQRPVVNNSSRRAFSEPYRSDRPRVHLNRRKAAIPILNEERCESPMIGGEDLRDEIVGIELRRGELEFQEIIDPSIVSRALYENEKQDGAATDNHQKEHYYLNPSETVNLRSSIHLEDLKDYIQCEIQDGIESETQEIDCCIEDLKLRVSEVEQSSSSLKKLIPSISTLADHSPKLEHYKGILVRNMENRMDETRAEVAGRAV